MISDDSLSWKKTLVFPTVFPEVNVYVNVRYGVSILKWTVHANVKHIEMLSSARPEITVTLCEAPYPQARKCK